MSSITIRSLDVAEWPQLRDLRLRALEDAPGVYSATYEEVARRSETDWRAMITDPARQVFGLFDVDTMIGITGIFTSSEDSSGQTAVLVMSYIVREYRRRGLSRMLYEARLAWARAHPKLTRIVVSHRESNEASRRANQRHGFVPTGRIDSRVWPDGSTEDEVFYELQLSKPVR
jgi:RimJ/RimL family protein N-acetyltransferase